MGRFLNKWLILEECKKKRYSIEYILFHADITRNAFAQAAYIKTNGRILIGPLKKEAPEIIKNIAHLLKVRVSDITSTIPDIRKVSNTYGVVDHLFINKKTVKKLCSNQQRSVAWALNKAGLSSNDYNGMTYLKINKDGSLSPVKKPNKYAVALAEILDCSLEDLFVNVSNINIHENN